MCEHVDINGHDMWREEVDAILRGTAKDLMERGLAPTVDWTASPPSDDVVPVEKTALPAPRGPFVLSSFRLRQVFGFVSGCSSNRRGSTG
ncbi:hypothetical protein TELCIR_08290 [Teladorsagia circumcincta]|uniref:Uncharacterized protein n=1 Tax=Teladorsagia circumcincta TaxID=45464 RepID=A0A2G9UJF5_TELCI|nr:hypothetical protein TELCIR_08290 [Teladorsagia circumcincta]